ncbi:serine hydrolase [Capnocytophaga canimorsus]|uniref:serine hydrolase domain-containing protein n=1 Tax=Capnocytophaga canimorsus TaxID=28188 RepID=UPI000D6EA036|nr:serine hydrolase [Capnocytophaga canimorsus]AWL79559.1 serine hydrolase [Capnocytophaga canimorsus]MDT9500242.1 beta-lactamase family protein [Capnocytophaga canimorsus]
MKKFVIGALLLLLFVVGGMYAMGYGYIFKAMRIIYGSGHKTAFLSDYQRFDNRVIRKGSYTEPWALHAQCNKVQTPKSLEVLHQKYKTVAFLIIKNDSIWHEQYFEGYTQKSLSNSFSMAKTYVSALLGKAITDGYIKDLQQPVGDFFPEFSKGLAAKLTVGDLGSMASGLDWNEDYYNPFSITTKAYFDAPLQEIILNLKVTDPPGKKYEYKSGNTQLLAMVIEKATGKTLSEYLSQSLWEPLGCEYDALWQLDDKEGTEKAYCCIASNARDFARLGKLYKDFGQWHGKQLLDSAYVAKSIQPRFSDSPQYGYGMWLLNYKNKSFFMMRGHLGQYVIVDPKNNVIIVRLGHLDADDSQNIFGADIYGYIDETYKLMN